MGVTVVEPQGWVELHELWGRLERLKTGIGGWIITAAAMPPGSPEAVDASRRIWTATEEALEVRERIKALQGGPVAVPEPRPAEPDPDPVEAVEAADPPRLVAPTPAAMNPPVSAPGEYTARLLRRLRDLPAHRADA